MDSTSSANLAYMEGLYSEYVKEPTAIPRDWRNYFDQLKNNGSGAGLAEARGSTEGESRSPQRTSFTVQDRLLRMIQAYRATGHRVARIDPLNLLERRQPELDGAAQGLADADPSLLYPGEVVHFRGPRKLADILARLRRTYCRSIGVEFMHITDGALTGWLAERMESTENRPELTREERMRILARLTHAATFEEFIRKKFIGAKSFSIEGAESLIPLLDAAIEKAAEHGLQEIVLAMAHRGRLNVLANIIGKRPREIFREFDDPPETSREGSGDVKYHLGHSHDYTTASGKKIHLSLCFNPSHIEFVNPVALGRTRAKQDRARDGERTRGMTVMIHGDAGFAGEGIAQETLNLSRLEGYHVGGSLHVIVNNQIGFTTSPAEGRSTRYATDVAKMLEIPIFHVNGDDPEAVVHVVRLAMDFRQRFGRDAVIDFYCYRRFGHNEGDEPSFTQPMLYQTIKNHRTTRERYFQYLSAHHGITSEEASRMESEFRAKLEEEFVLMRGDDFNFSDQPLRGLWAGYYGGPENQAEQIETGVEPKRLAALLEIQTRLPDEFHPHPKIERGIEARRQMAAGKRPLDWSAAESLAFATLAADGVRVRLSGQDSERGTFSHRHAVLHDYQNGRTYFPLKHLSPHQAPVEIYDSPLSEAGVLGFEYGYSLDCPDGLVLWEAQFGDFSNVAQVIIDQFITSAEQKWRRLSGVVLLLPHGLEGMGPEHSSTRLERFLQLAANDNIQIIYPTTPAQYFHCLRRQALRKWRKPLVVLTPKSLLRHPRAVSTLAECSTEKFRPVISDAPRAGVARVNLCSGKLYYDLEAKRQELARHDVALIRIEQLYPLPEKALRDALASFPLETPIYWVQEEPENMGAWSYLNLIFRGRLFDRHPFSVVCRPRSASPAHGSARTHRVEQEQLLAQALSES